MAHSHLLRSLAMVHSPDFTFKTSKVYVDQSREIRVPDDGGSTVTFQKSDLDMYLARYQLVPEGTGSVDSAVGECLLYY